MRVSIVIPAFNGRKWIRAAVDSALAQVLIDSDGLPELYDVWVRDAGSTDGTLDPLEGIQDHRLHILRAPANLGLPHSFQRPFALATTPHPSALAHPHPLPPHPPP